jgi:hypothetical protein
MKNLTPKNTPHLKVRNFYIESRPKGRTTRRYVVRDGKLVEVYRDEHRVIEKKDDKGA